jgi:hypothetical protein
MLCVSLYVASKHVFSLSTSSVLYDVNPYTYFINGHILCFMFHYKLYKYALSSSSSNSLYGVNPYMCFIYFFQCCSVMCLVFGSR